jgi:hypothetical protein
MVEVLPDPAFAGSLGPADLMERFANRADELGASIGAVAERVRDALQSQLSRDHPGAWGLSEVGLTLSVSLEAESGIVIAKAKTGGTFEVALTWSCVRDGASEGR